MSQRQGRAVAHPLATTTGTAEWSDLSCMKAANVVTDEDFNWGQTFILFWDGPNKGAYVIANCFTNRKK